VLTAYARVAPLGWLVFVETPIREAYAPLYASIARTGLVLIGALGLAAVAGTLLARRMVVPIQALRVGAERIGSGDLGQRIVIKTGDEVEALADQFNDMAGRLQESYADLERKVEDRTNELARSVTELRALGEVSQAINSTLDLETVLSTIVAKAVQLSGTEAGAIYGYDEPSREFHLRATYGMSKEMIDALAQRHIGLDERNVGPAIARHEPIQVADLMDEAFVPVNEIILRAGFRALLVAPLVRGEEIVGLLVVRRRTPGQFAQNTVDLVKTFAAQSVLAIQNARLFHEIEEKGVQLAEASTHKSQFLANMSHELRTPLNAILGYTELILDNIYGEAPAKIRTVLERVQTNGKHLLGLINDVLDLSKIEAGQVVLALADYSIKDLVQTVYSAVEPLANSKKLKFRIDMPPDLPRAHGDDQRLKQVLLNLVGNAIKFTDAGEVSINATATRNAYTIAVHDTGPGIAKEDQARIFEEFQQADNSVAKAKGGTGLGLSIAKRIVEMHGGRLWLESKPGSGSTFSFTVPLTVEKQV
jgi:signal transduction histidine kinase